MSAVARFLARLLWRALLWFMRRKWMKRLEGGYVQLAPPSLRGATRRAMLRRKRVSRRIGLPMLTFMMNLVIACLLISCTFSVAMYLFEHGYLSVPYRLRRRLFE